MKPAPYMNKVEVEDYLRLGSMADMAKEMAERTPVPEWRKKLKAVGTYCFNIATQRLESLDSKELVKLKGRVERKQVLIYEKDEVKLLESRLSGKGKHMEVDVDAWVTLLKVVDNFVCRHCKQGDMVKGCEVRQLLHRCMAPIYESDPAPGTCEFHWESECQDTDIKIKEKDNE